MITGNALASFKIGRFPGGRPIGAVDNVLGWANLVEITVAYARYQVQPVGKINICAYIPGCFACILVVDLGLKLLESGVGTACAGFEFVPGILQTAFPS